MIGKQVSCTIIVHVPPVSLIQKYQRKVSLFTQNNFYTFTATFFSHYIIKIPKVGIAILIHIKIIITLKVVILSKVMFLIKLGANGKFLLKLLGLI